jgi:alpha-glucosidase
MTPWWQGAVIYQIYPRSFRDTSGDGIGDLPGIAERLEHVASLGADAVWISPFFRSPMKDYGYDVADYRDVDPMFGTLEDFDHVLARAHGLGLKVLVDLVLSHTSDRHEWFLESRSSHGNPRSDWYVWADARRDGTPPNNWLSIFGGPAWQWEPRRRQYYLHNFLAEQPDLNIHNPAVVEALLDVARFWLERGVDGFRLDAIDFALHDEQLRDNPPRPPHVPVPRGLPEGIPYSRQLHVFGKSRPELADRLLKPLRRLAESYGDILLLGEISGDGQLERLVEYTRDALHVGYTFDLLHGGTDAATIRGVTEQVEDRIEGGWACWSLSNHDVVRAPTRFGGDDPPEALRKLLPVLLCCLRGTICLYQGEELGLEEADLAFEDLRDPYGITFWPYFKGRDGCRTPMPWQADAPHAGFGEARPWLPVPDSHRRRAVDVQERGTDSVLHAVRRFLRWRRTQTPLRLGSKRHLDLPVPLLGLVREHAGESVLCLFNLGAKPARIEPPCPVEPLSGHGFETAVEDNVIVLPGFGAWFGRPARGG